MTDPLPEDLGPDNLFLVRELRERRHAAQRIKQFNAILTTAGDALLGGGGWEPFLKGLPLKINHVIALLVGVAVLGLSVYFAPDGEVDNVGK